MATRSRIGVVLPDGKVKSIYCHWNGYPDGVGQTLVSKYNSQSKAEALVALGDSSTPGEPYTRRGESFNDRTDESQKEYWNSDLEEYGYLFVDGEWLCQKQYTSEGEDAEIYHLSILINTKNMANGATTAKHIKFHLGDILKDQAKVQGVKAIEPLQLVDKLEQIFGKNIHDCIDGFINYAEKNPMKISPGALVATLVHDINGALQEDKLLLPRTTAYEKYASVEVKPDTVLAFFPDVDEQMLELFELARVKTDEHVEMSIEDATEEDVLPILDILKEEDEEFSDYIGGFGFAILENNTKLFIDYIKFKEKHEC